jgi:hypothetical protein
MYANQKRIQSQATCMEEGFFTYIIFLLLGINPRTLSTLSLELCSNPFGSFFLREDLSK